MESYLRWFAPLARVSVAVIFMVSAINKLVDPASSLAYMQANAVPAAPFLLYGAVFLEFFGGVGLILGWYTRAAALGLVVFLIPTTLIFHDFWNMAGVMAQTQQSMFLKNLAILGSALFFMAVGPGPISIDGWIQDRKKSKVIPSEGRKEEQEVKKAI